jgi:hypothetical protein
MKAVGPNEHCPCGSGRKYKKCHGRAAQPKSSAVPVVVGLLVAGLAATAYLTQSSGGGMGAAPGGSPSGAPARMGQPWEYDAASNMHFDPSPGHNHWHAGPPPAGLGATP